MTEINLTHIQTTVAVAGTHIKVRTGRVPLKINWLKKRNLSFYIFLLYALMWFGIIENTITYPIGIIKEFIK